MIDRIAAIIPYEKSKNTEIIIKPEAKCDLTSPIIFRKKIYEEKCLY